MQTEYIVNYKVCEMRALNMYTIDFLWTFKVDDHRHVISTYVYMHINFTQKIEARYKVSSLNVKLSEVQILSLCVTFLTLPLFYMWKYIVCTYAVKIMLS